MATVPTLPAQPTLSPQEDIAQVPAHGTAQTPVERLPPELLAAIFFLACNASGTFDNVTRG